MYPEADYKIGFEKGVGREGNAPFLLYNILPLDIAFFLLFLMPAFTNYIRPISFQFSLFNLLLWFTFSLAVILLILISFQLVLRKRFRKLYSCPELEEIISRAKRRMGFSRHAELWILQSSKQVLLPLSGLMYHSIVISKRTEEDLLTSPENAEIVLADNLKDLEGQPVLSTWFPVLLFVPISFFPVQWIGLTTSLALSILWAFYWIMITTEGIWLAAGGRVREKNPVLIEYNTHPDVARCHVFRKSPPNEDELQSIFKIPHDPLNITNNRLAGFSSYFVSIIVSTGLVLVLTLWISTLPVLSAPFEAVNSFLLFVPIIVALIGFHALFYYFTKRFYNTSDSD